MAEAAKGQDAPTHPGVDWLLVHRTDWHPKRVWRTYTMLTDLAAVFRSRNSELGLHSPYRHKEKRFDGHLFITVLWPTRPCR